MASAAHIRAAAAAAAAIASAARESAFTRAFIPCGMAK